MYNYYCYVNILLHLCWLKSFIYLYICKIFIFNCISSSLIMILSFLRSKSKKTIYTDGLLTFTWQRPTFPGPFGPSIIGPGGLNFRVRDGNGWNPSGIITRSESILSKLHRVFQCQKSFPPTLNCERCHTDVASVAPTWMVIGSDPLLE